MGLEVRRSTPLRGKFALERSSSGVLEARWSKFHPREILLLEEIPG
jgi:hypothetical protein